MSQNRIERERVARERDAENHRRQVAAIQAETERAKLLASEDLGLLVSQFGPILWDVILLARAGVDAADPLRGAPTEDTSRVGRPSSERVEGAPTEHNRRALETFKRRLGRLVADFAGQLGAELVDRRAFSAHVRWHLTENTPTHDCDYCRLDPRLRCQHVSRGERCDRVAREDGVCVKHQEAA